MFDDLTRSSLIYWGLAAVVVGTALGFLPRGRFRLGLIISWALLPVWLMMVVIVGGGADFATLTFGTVFLLFTLPTWGVLALLPFNLVRRVREIHANE